MVFLAQTFSAINFWIFLQTITKHISKNIYFSFFFFDLISKKKETQLRNENFDPVATNIPTGVLRSIYLALISHERTIDSSDIYVYENVSFI